MKRLLILLGSRHADSNKAVPDLLYYGNSKEDRALAAAEAVKQKSESGVPVYDHFLVLEHLHLQKRSIHTFLPQLRELGVDPATVLSPEEARARVAAA